MSDSAFEICLYNRADSLWTPASRSHDLSKCVLSYYQFLALKTSSKSICSWYQMLWPGLSLLIEDLLLMYWAVWLVLAEAHFAALKSVSQFCRMCFLSFGFVLLSRVLSDEFLRLSQLIDPCAGTNSWSHCINSSSTIFVCVLSASAHGDRWDERLYQGWGEARIFAYASASSDSVERCLIQLGYFRIWIHFPGLRSVLIFKSSWIANLAIDPFAWIATSKQVDPKMMRAIHVHAVMSEALSKQKVQIITVLWFR